MKCPKCGSRTRIIDSRPSALGTRRRHECSNHHRTTTFEVQAALLYRLASDVLREPGFFSREERGLEETVNKFVDRHQPLKLIKTG